MIFLCITIQMIPVKMNDDMYDIYVYLFMYCISINLNHCHCYWVFLYVRAFTTCYKSELKIRSSYCAPVPIWLWNTSGENSQNAFIDILSSLACGLEENSTVAVRLFLYKYLEGNHSWNITNYFVDFTLKTLPRILIAIEVGYESVLTDCPDKLSLALCYFNRC